MDFSKETILIVDDSHFQRTIIKELFQEHFNLIEATSGGECMRIIEEKTTTIDLVLLDLVMPGIDGFEVLRRRQNMQDFLDTPIIVLTTSDSHEIQASAYELGANDFLTKPIEEDIALSRIQNLLKSKNRVKSLIHKYVEFKVKSELDAMTGLFNKMTTMNFVSDVLSQQPTQQHAMLAVDIDNFKAINDIHGHTVGDHVISIVSNIIVSQFNGSEIVGRIGGDEFIVFAQNISSKEEIYQKTENLVQIISEKKKLSIPDNVTISIGLVFSDGNERDFNSMFVKADEALYASKHAGKSCYSEYGANTLDENLPARTVLVLSHSRNVISTLSFTCEAQTAVRQITSKEEMDENVFRKGSDISRAYLDISDEPDNGKELLSFIDTLPAATIPIIVICREGCMEQIRLAVSYPFVRDILFSPLETATLQRRIAEHGK